MKEMMITAAIMVVLQMCMLVAILITDNDGYTTKDNMYITTKMRVLQFFVPFFWVPKAFVAIINWWNKLK
jgi:hypothetical protein